MPNTNLLITQLIDIGMFSLDKIFSNFIICSKVESDQGDQDDTALNGIRLYCEHYNKNNEKSSAGYCIKPWFLFLFCKFNFVWHTSWCFGYSKEGDIIFLYSILGKFNLQ